MRRNTISSSIIVALILSVLVNPFIAAQDSTITNNTVWSGHIVLDGNIRIPQGITLVISPGTTIDGGEGYTIEVAGDLEAQAAHFYSSANPNSQASHGQGLWQGIVVNSTGSVTLTDVIIENSNVGVKSQGEITIQNLTVADSYIGLNNMGIGQVNHFSSNAVDHEAIINSGQISIAQADIANSSTGLLSTGDATISSSRFSNVGSAIIANRGEMIAENITLETVSVGFATTAGASVAVKHVNGLNVSLLVDQSNADDFQLQHGSVSGDRLSKSSGATKSLVSDIVFSSSTSNQQPVIDHNCEGICQISNTTITAAKKAILLSGTGNHRIDNASISAQIYALRCSGTGRLSVDNSTFNSIQNGVIIRETNSNFNGQVMISTLEHQSIGLDVLAGVHNWAAVTIFKDFNHQDSESIASQIWYADVTVKDFQALNYSTGVKVRYGKLAAKSLFNYGGKETAIHLISSTLEADNLRTKYQNNGVLMTKQSKMIIHEWVAELHYEPLRLANLSTAHILNFTTINTNPESGDAVGDGTLNYGSAQNLAISTSESHHFVVTEITITDMSGNPVQAAIITNMFSFTSDENGKASVPLFLTGSVVAVNLFGTGTSKLMFGGASGQVIEIPAIPNGDWNLISGDLITIKSDNGAQLINGNITLTGNATLILDGTELIMPENKSITLNDQSQIIGRDAVIKTGEISINDLATITSIDQSLQMVVKAEVFWDCTSPIKIYNVVFNDALSITSQCDLINLGGAVNGAVFTTLESSLNVTSTFNISVLDQGAPIQGAIITYQENTFTTNQQGQAELIATSRYVGDGQDFNGTLETILLSYGEFNELTIWDTTKSKHEQFVISIIRLDIMQSNEVVLEKIWSPYYLDFDLTIPLGSTLTISDGVALRISDQVKIIVEGTLLSDNGVFSSTGFGDRWGGIILGNSQFSNIKLSHSSIFEASPAVTITSTGTFSADNSYFSRALPVNPLIDILANSAAQVEVYNSQLVDGGSSCIEVGDSLTNLTLSNISFERCSGPALRAENIELSLESITIGAGSSHGLVLSSVTGSLNGLDGIEFDGTGNLLKLNYINNDFLVENVVGRTGQSSAISGANNRALDLQTVEIIGSPGIVLESSAGTLSNIMLHGLGAGTGLIINHGRNGQNLVLDNVHISGYNTGINLHADGAQSTSRLQILASTINASTAVFSDAYPLSIYSTQIDGVIELNGEITYQLFDTRVISQESITLSNGAIVEIYRPIKLISTSPITSVQADYYLELNYSNGSQVGVEAYGNASLIYVMLFTKFADDSPILELQNMTVTAISAGYLPQVKSVELVNTITEIEFIMQINSPPEITNTRPNSSTKIMQGKEFIAQITANDDFDTPSQMFYTWEIFDDRGNLIDNFTSASNQQTLIITSPGNYLISFTVTDSLGALSEVITPIEVLLLDSDGDFVDTCNQETWYDSSISRSCGPDIYDNDDDNDGFIDSRDVWPTDPCAWQDTDYDNQPDNLNCPIGVTTNLYEDQDDDGDGIPDVLENTSASADGQFDSVTLILLVVGMIVTIIFFIRIRTRG